MADLLEFTWPDGPDCVTVLNLYCWPCNALHQLPVADVERVVYALGALERHAYDVAAADPSFGRELVDTPTTCLLTVLRVAGDAEMAAEHVEQGVACREAAPWAVSGE